MKLNIDLKKFSWLKKVTGNISLLLIGFLVIMAIIVAFIVWGEVHRAIQLSSSSAISQTPVVRIDQQKYKELEDRLDENAHFMPTPMPKASVFSTPPKQNTQNQ